MLIGRLITDERFRSEFLKSPEATLNNLCERGLELSRTEIAALVDTEPLLWTQAAARLDRRLQKINLTDQAEA
jgi:hypothetical protein